MKKLNVFVCMTGLLIYLLISSATCNGPFAPNLEDTTPPGIYVEVQIEAPYPPNPRNTFDISTMGSFGYVIPPDYSIRLIAVGTDNESGIESITIEGKLFYTCSAGLNPYIKGSPESVNIIEKFDSFTQPTDLNRSFTLNVVADSLISKLCNGLSENGKGPHTIWGDLIVVVTNGATNGTNRISTSGKFNFTANDIGDNNY